MTPEQEAKEAWAIKAKKEFNDDILEQNSYLLAIEDFQSSLIEELEKIKQPIDVSDTFGQGWNSSLEKAIELIKTITPKIK